MEQRDRRLLKSSAKPLASGDGAARLRKSFRAFASTRVGGTSATASSSQDDRLLAAGRISEPDSYGLERRTLAPPSHSVNTWRRSHHIHRLKNRSELTLRRHRRVLRNGANLARSTRDAVPMLMRVAARRHVGPPARALELRTLARRSRPAPIERRRGENAYRGVIAAILTHAARVDKLSTVRPAGLKPLDRDGTKEYGPE